MIKYIKTKITKYFLLVFLLLGNLIYGQGLRKSHHDFSEIFGNGNEICKPCHTPNKDIQEAVNNPLWDHKIDSVGYQMYTSYAIKGMSGQPTGISKLCLSCHDGTFAPDSHGANAKVLNIFDRQNLRTSIRKDHPVSFVYDSILANKNKYLYDPNKTPSGLGNTIAIDLLENNRMECTSCHDVHIFRNTQGDCTGCHIIEEGKILFTKSLSLWQSNDRSSFCFICHKK